MIFQINKKKIILVGLLIFSVCACGFSSVDIAELEKERVIRLADSYLNEKPITVTDFKAERSAGGIHDYYSEGDYWWPNPKDPNAPYIRKDGLTNPDNFVSHRKAMRRFSLIVPALVGAYKITEDPKYLNAALKHIEAWFVNEATKMNPNLLYSQAIFGKATGRGIGIIDTIHLVEIVQSLIVLDSYSVIDQSRMEKIKAWFSEYLEWLTTSDFGIAERDNGNNHSTCWLMQVGIYAKFVDDSQTLKYCRDFFKIEIIESQMATDGSFPLELKRTKPYGYSLFNLDALVICAKILSNDENNLWEYRTENGRSVKLAVDFMYPFIKDKSVWPYEKDVMYWENWPVRHPSLIFAYEAFGEKKYVDLWIELEPEPQMEEIIRNYPLRQPILWID
ncbi:MAG: alginate lyase family protein [Melioribacteraceae bacterium]|nr:alginate lyase family protein [Melioribacteraceae bacterium]MCF8432175.1 alginate lyase family protein [Melioribacteraceae bacterium]